MDSELCHFILCPKAIYVTELSLYIYIYTYISKFENCDFKIYKSPDMQSTNVKHDSYMAVICPENIR